MTTAVALSLGDAVGHLLAGAACVVVRRGVVVARGAAGVLGVEFACPALAGAATVYMAPYVTECENPVRACSVERERDRKREREKERERETKRGRERERERERERVNFCIR